MKTIAIYTRVSSDRQKQENTIASQLEEVIEFSKKNGFVIAEELIYQDDGFSGSNFRRPALEKLRDRLSEGDVDAVLAHSPDRLARNYVHQEILREEFKKQGVDLLFLKTPNASTPEEKLMLQFQGMIAEYERTLITERTRRGKKHRAKAGCVSVLSGAPLGFRYIKSSKENDAYYQIVPAEAEVVREVFRLYTEEQMSLAAMTRELKKKKIAKRKGSLNWSTSSLRNILKNPAYTGTAFYGKTCKKDRPATPLTRRKKPTISPKTCYKKTTAVDSWIPIKVPVIISQDIFDLAQVFLDKNKKQSRRNTKEPSLLQSLLVCDVCGKSYIKYGMKYYRCIGSDKSRITHGSTCKNGLIRLNDADDYVWGHIVELLKDPDMVQKEVERRIGEAKDVEANKRQVGILSKELQKVEKGINSLLDAYQEQLVSLKDLRERMPKVQMRKNAIIKQLEALKSQEINMEMTLKVSLNVKSFVERLNQRSLDLPVEEKQKIVRLIVKKILIGKKTEGKRDLTIVHCIPTKESCLGITNENLQLCAGRLGL